MAAHIKKGDMVQIMTGDYKGATGKVLRVITSKNQVVVEGQNRKYRHVKPSQKNPQGGRIQVELPINMSNVLPVSPKSSTGQRVHYEIDKNGSKKRVTVDGSEVGIVKKA